MVSQAKQAGIPQSTVHCAKVGVWKWKSPFSTARMRPFASLKHRKCLFVLLCYLYHWKVFASIDAKSSIWQAAESVPLAITRKSIISSPADCFNLQRALIKSSSPFSHPTYRPLQIVHCHAISRRGSRFATTTTSSTDLNLEGGGGGRGSNVLSVKHEGPLCS